MGRELRQPPSAACLSASMRDLGYSLDTAVADLVDNSISADASTVEIIFDPKGKPPAVVILDDGHGMDEAELITAMRHGAVGPHEERSSADLGRFGLGLKTASFSQCRSLTVVSRQDGQLSGAEWSLDRIDRLDDWVLVMLDPEEVKALPYVDHLGGNGTAVIWRELDRLTEEEQGAHTDEIVNEKVEMATRHLALVFHRFLAGEVKGRPKLSITVNGRSVEAFDPFCRKNRATQVLPEEIVRVDESEVRMQPYVLPHHSRLSQTEYDYYADRSDFLSNQGVYIYRNGRLMAWGGWFRLVPKGEATKLARVQIDFPNTLDEAWTIDIKKSRARPPRLVKERLRQIIDRITTRSVDIHRKRGSKRFQEAKAPFWERYVDHYGILYAINTGHPLVISLRTLMPPTSARSFDMLLDSIAAALPVEMIYSDYSTDPRDVGHREVAEEDVDQRLQDLYQALFDGKVGDEKVFRQVVMSTHLFNGREALVDKFIKETFG